MKNLRTAAVREKYDTYLKTRDPLTPCELCSRTPIKAFTFWKIIPNHFPYDRIATVHDMLIPHRHVKESELIDDERKELLLIKENELGEYQYLIEAAKGHKSIPGHFHLHLIVEKILD
jgi:hypothetical protein